MDHRKFDRLTQQVRAAGSRRQALRAVLGAAIVGSTTKHAAANVRRAPKGRGEICADGSTCHGDSCCGRECCPGRCFVTEEDNRGNPTGWMCCRPPDGVMCEDENARGGVVCCPYNSQATNEQACSCIGGEVITGSYRRR